MARRWQGTGDHGLGVYLQDSDDPGLFMLGTHLLHQVDTLHCLEFLSIDEEYRASGLRVKVTFQREHPSIQRHSTPVAGPDIGSCRAEAVRAMGESVEIF